MDSLYLNSEIYLPETDEPVKMEYSCYFPAHFFNRGLFKLSLFITDNQNEIYHLGEAFYFEISLPEHDVDENFFYRKYPGPLRPRLNWKIEAL